MITQKELKSLLSYDEKTGIFTWLLPRINNKIKAGSVAGALHHTGYLYIGINKKYYGAHRLAWLYVYGSFPNDMIDHINGNSIDNKIDNLRLSTNTQNQYNQKISKNNTSGIKGVCWHKVAQKWSARIRFNGKRIYLGLFENLELAELVINEARNKYHGEFARNF